MIDGFGIHYDRTIFKVRATAQADGTFTEGKEYDAWGLSPDNDVDPSVFVVEDDLGRNSALFHGEFEIV